MHMATIGFTCYIELVQVFLCARNTSGSYGFKYALESRGPTNRGNSSECFSSFRLLTFAAVVAVKISTRTRDPRR